MTQGSRRTGFTVIELMLAMTFISVLLMVIVMTIIHVGKIYNRGLILKSVNQSGRDISDTIRRDFMQSDQRMVYRNPSDIITVKLESGEPVSGRFCLGQYSYLWNYPIVFNDLSYSSSTSAIKDSEGLINFVRVVDPDASLCQPPGDVVDLLDSEKITHILKSPVVAGADSEVVLAIHDISVDEVAVVPDNSDGLFDVSFTIGTSKLSEIDSMSCRPPADSESNLEFCAINQFNMIVRTNG